MCIRQTDQQIPNQLVLGLQFGTVTIAGVPKTEASACESNADTPWPDCYHGHLTCLSFLKLSYYGGATGRCFRCLGSGIRIWIA